MASADAEEGEQEDDGIVKVEEHDDDDDNQGESATAQAAPASTQTNTAHAPPTLQEMLDKPKAFRRYVRYLANNVPQAPPEVVGDAFRKWEYRHLLMATLTHLLTVFQHDDEPQQRAWRFYQDWLVVNNTDYKESRFMSFDGAGRLFRHEAEGRRRCRRVAVGLPEVGSRGGGRKRKGKGKGKGARKGGKGEKKMKRKTMLEE